MKLPFPKVLGGGIACGLGIIALRYSTPIAVQLTYSAALLFTAWTIIAALIVRGPRQTFWVGAAVFSLSYMFLIAGGLGAIRGQSGVAVHLLLSDQLLMRLGQQDYGSANPIGGQPFELIWGELLLHAAVENGYLLIGHCLFAILAGLCGGWCAQRFLGPTGLVPVSSSVRGGGRSLSLRALFGWVTLAAGITAAVTQTSIFFTSVCFTAAVGFTIWSLMSACVVRDERRPFWIAAAVISLGYFFLLGGGLTPLDGSREIGPRLLVTEDLLRHGLPPNTFLARDGFTEVELWSVELLFNPGEPPPPPTASPPSAPQLPSAAPNPYPSPSYQPAPTPAALVESSHTAQQCRTLRYLLNCHCLFVILFGLAGGWAANHFLAAPNEPKPTAAE